MPLAGSVVGHGGERLIAVHGWLGDHRLYEPFLDSIDPDRVTCAFLDCRGYGGRLEESGPCTIDGIAADVLSLAGQLGWEAFGVIGHSMGAMAAQRLMVDAPERIRSAILVAPVPASGARVDSGRRALLLRAIADPAARRELIDINTGRRRDNRWLDQLLELSLLSTGRRALEEYMAAWTETDFAAEVAGSEVPVLAICGELDPASPAQRMRETILVWCRHASLVVMEGAGHYPMREDPAGLWRVISHHLSWLPGGDPTGARGRQFQIGAGRARD